MGGGTLPSVCQDRGGSLALRCHADTACPCQPVPPCSQGRKWWMNTDEPWQVLACCMEIAKASRSPDPAAYISHFPVHQVGAQQAHGAEWSGEVRLGRSIQICSAAFTAPRGQAFLRQGVQAPCLENTVIRCCLQPFLSQCSRVPLGFLWPERSLVGRAPAPPQGESWAGLTFSSH